jgi:hypothetical protein
VQANGSASSAGAVTKADVSNDSVSNFPSASGILIQGGNAALGPQAVLGTPGSGTNIISITGNAISGASSAAPMGSNGIQTAMTGTGQAKFSITNNGTLLAPIGHFAGVGITSSGGNLANVVSIITNNFIDAGDNIFGSNGMAVGSQLGVGQAGSIKADIENNTINHADGHEIFAGVTNSDNSANLIIKNNTLGAPDGSSETALQVNSGSSSGNTNLCLDMTGNTAIGTGGFPGTGVRKQGTVSNVNTFGIVGLSPSPATANQTEDYLGTQNPLSAFGAVGFSNDGSRAVRVIVNSGSNFVSCSAFTVS